MFGKKHKITDFLKLTYSLDNDHLTQQNLLLYLSRMIAELEGLCLKYKISFFFKGNSLTSAFKEAD